MIYQITVNEKNIVTGWSIGGYIPKGIDVSEIPENIINSGDLNKWCYTAEKGFYENPDYTPPIIPDEPVITTEQRLTAAENAIEEIINIIMEG